MFPRSVFEFGGSSYDIDADAAITSAMLTMQATGNGYAWSSHGRLQKAALGVIFASVAFALAHFYYSAWTGWTSTWWETAPEVIALAMNSQATERLHSTSTGIETVRPLKVKGNVRFVHGHLESVFHDTGDGGSSVCPTVKYAEFCYEEDDLCHPIIDCEGSTE